jgi:hypothetical protein
MIEVRRGVTVLSQDDIGYELGLIVPPEVASQFEKVSTGAEPRTGYGTQTSKNKFSIELFFRRHHPEFNFKHTTPSTLAEHRQILEQCKSPSVDLIICYNSQKLFGDGDPEHTSLIESYDLSNDRIAIVDPAIGVPKLRKTSAKKLFDVIRSHELSNIAGFWIVSTERQ